MSYTQYRNRIYVGMWAIILTVIAVVINILIFLCGGDHEVGLGDVFGGIFLTAVGIGCVCAVGGYCTQAVDRFYKICDHRGQDPLFALVRRSLTYTDVTDRVGDWLWSPFAFKMSYSFEDLDWFPSWLMMRRFERHMRELGFKVNRYSKMNQSTKDAIRQLCALLRERDELC